MDDVDLGREIVRGLRAQVEHTRSLYDGLLELNKDFRLKVPEAFHPAIMAYLDWCDPVEREVEPDAEVRVHIHGVWIDWV